MADSDLRHSIVNGLVGLPRIGDVVAGPTSLPPYLVVDENRLPVDAVIQYLRDIALSDASPATGRSYGYDLLRWFRLLWLLGMEWEHATEAETILMVGWLRTATNYQRRRQRPDSSAPGSVNTKTGKQSLRAGYAPTSINHWLSVVSGFYAYHGSFGRGPVINPVPESAERRRALMHLSPLEPKPVVRRARLRQKVPSTQPRSIPDRLWDELFAAMRNERDRALLLFYVSSAARASELLAITLDDIDWASQRIWVITKGTRLREDIPADPQAFVHLARYLEEDGLPASGEPIFRALRGESRALSYWAMRRVLQRANARLGTNWTLHDLRHTAAIRLVGDPKMALHEVQRILRHASISTLNVYTRVRVEDMFDRLQEHYSRPKPEVSYPVGYDKADVEAVFGV